MVHAGPSESQRSAASIATISLLGVAAFLVAACGGGSPRDAIARDLDLLARGQPAPEIKDWATFGSTAGFALVPDDVTLSVADVRVRGTDPGPYAVDFRLAATRASTSMESANCSATFTRLDGSNPSFAWSDSSCHLDDFRLIPDIASRSEADAFVASLKPRAKTFGVTVALTADTAPTASPPPATIVEEPTWLKGDERVESAGEAQVDTRTSLTTSLGQVQLFSEVATPAVAGVIHRGTLSLDEMQERAYESVKAFLGASRSGNVNAALAVLVNAGGLESAGLEDAANVSSFSQVTGPRDFPVTGADGTYVTSAGGRKLVWDATRGVWNIDYTGWPLSVKVLTGRAKIAVTTPADQAGSLCGARRWSSIVVDATGLIFRSQRSPFLRVRWQYANDGSTDCFRPESSYAVVATSVEVGGDEALSQNLVLGSVGSGEKALDLVYPGTSGATVRVTLAVVEDVWGSLGSSLGTAQLSTVLP